MTIGSNSEFLEYCHLVGDSFLQCPDEVPSADDASERQDNSDVPDALRDRARDFAKKVGISRNGGTFDKARTARQFKARLFTSPELAEWIYRQTRALHSNIVLEQRGVPGTAAARTFGIPYYLDGGKPVTVPRLAPCLGFVPCAQSHLKFPASFPNRANSDLLLDNHFAHAYLYLLAGLDQQVPRDLGLAPAVDLVIQEYTESWARDRKDLLRKVLGLTLVTDGKNVFGGSPRGSVADPAPLNFEPSDSERKKLYFWLISSFDHWIDHLGGWYQDQGVDWDPANFTRWIDGSDGEQVEIRMNIAFVEEAEILWELLRFYGAALAHEADALHRLMEMFWIAERAGQGWRSTHRGTALLKWAQQKGHLRTESLSDLEDALTEDPGSAPDILKKTRVIAPVHALLMALPPPEGIYRCEIAFRAIDDQDEHAVIKRAWCFTSINLPELLEDRDMAFSVLENVVAKQKLLVDLVLDPVARDRFKNAYREAIIRHGKRAAIAAIMSRNFSHNIGSHVLSNDSVVADSTDDEIRALHSYIQRRMDLVARITSRHPEWGEPLWFFNDLLRGFLRQRILLDHLVHDQGGWRADKIEFHLTVNTRDGNSKDSRIQYQNGSQDDGGRGWIACLDRSLESGDLEDFLVEAPDGIIGAQALYVVLEGLMRNSAKYGLADPPPANLEVHLDVVENDDDHYEIALWDNLSTCPSKERETDQLCFQMRERIRERLIDDRGGLSAESVGIAEMREAAAFLVHPHDKRFPRAKKEYPLWADCHKENGERYLRYLLDLAKPRMVAIAGLADSETLPNGASGLGVKKLDAKDELLGRDGDYQFAIVVAKDQGADELAWVRENRSYLPHRLLLVTASGDQPSQCLEGGTVLCSRDQIGLDKLLDCGDDGVSVSQRLILAAYQKCLEGRWLSARGFTLHVTFQRENPPNSWARIENGVGLADRYDVHVWTTKGDGQRRRENPVFTKGNSPTDDQRIHLHYANHSAGHLNKVADKDDKTKVAAEATILFANGDKTFEALWTPPSSDFGFAFFLLGLFEAALTRVLILDERVALWSLSQDEPDSGRVDRQVRARIWPLFGFRIIKGPEIFATETVKRLSEGVDAFSPPMLTPEKNGDEARITGSANGQDADGATCQMSWDTNEADVLVVHTGVQETSGREFAQRCSRNLEELYRTTAPAVIETSGRGGEGGKHSSSAYPFIEYSIISDCLRKHAAKYHLVRGLLSTKASKRAPNEGEKDG